MFAINKKTNNKIKVHRKIRFGFLLGSLMLMSVAAKAQKEPFNTVLQRINNDLQAFVKDKVLSDKIANNLKNLNADGSWADINYNDAQYDPLKRIKDMVTAYIRPSNKLYQNTQLYGSIVKSLQNWLDKNPKNKNWWYNDIFYPQAIGETLILMRNAKTQLPAELENALIKRMIRRLKTGDGANTSDEALHYLYRACLTQNKATLDSAAKYLFEPIAIADGKEGVQIDGSYYQHGKQQAIASYGRVFAGNSVNAAFYLRGTEYALPKDQLAILVNYLKNTFLKTVRGSFYDFNVRGRGISRKDSLSSGIGSMVSKIKLFDPENAAYWDASLMRTSDKKAVDYGITASHSQYWKSGYTLHLRKAYTFSVQTASTRTLRTERGNNENILGKFLSDGATNIQRSGSEYANLMPVWEWDKIPGTTSRDYPDDNGATIKSDWGIPGTTQFVGGVSDGIYGVSCYDLNYDSVQAKKAWFFFDKEVVCLGAGIKSSTKENITTTINQTWLRGRVFSSNGAQKNDKGEIWAIHDSIGYVFPQGGDLEISNKVQTGNWYRINHFQSKTELKHDVFKIWLNHGVNPQNACYQYIVVPGVDAAGLKKYNRSMIQILKNTEELQAVKHTGLNMLQAVFYKAGTLAADGLSLQVDQPCTVYIKDLSSKNPMLYIADPAQANTNIKVLLKLSAMSKTQNINCNLPAGALSGATANFKIKE
ncbi:polysaccharide lyase family 8 super-sandwich domain-containing protein [Pedobacter sp. SG918]|uniref:polysaccharide lyase family 8 super-sandwich domain-containing protein n=2 Tax=unclassified Pedobacter TaxID=2628915 RepID=UPI00146BC8A4|nr:polysaccharide lyase family 8 super-sandwich domain-containing protein [Pedobacter sp. SG918]NII81111.1 chondroitin AC lyase [Pedobacter sp. SG908]NMN35128.1 chondroitin AC lyase [Pedobacter sp. SG918]